MNPVLEVSKLSMNFGGLKALENISLDIFQNEIVSLIGPNGAGKTTFFNCITGIYTPVSGDIFISSLPQKTEKENICGLKPNIITKKGMARTFQNIRLFQNMTVLENVMIGRHVRTHAGIIASVLKLKKTRNEEKKIVDDSYNILKKTGIENFANEKASTLPYGAQRKLEIARALATEPFLLLLDEPAAGMNPAETIELGLLIKEIREKENISILLIEHDMKFVMNLCDKIFVLDYGKKIASGTPDAIQNNPVVIKAYLGEDFDFDA